MRPLIYLAHRTMVNGLKRALGSVQRLIGLLFIGGYWAYYIFNSGAGSRSFSFTPHGRPFHFDFPVGQVLDALCFAVFAILSLPFLSMVANYNRVMRPADVDVLFPTPVSPKWVMAFRVVRDFLGTLLFPVVILVFSRRYIPLKEITGAVGPNAGWELGRTWSLAWILLSLVWTAIGYAATLFINRSDLASDRNKKILDWGTAIVVVGTLAFVGYSVTHPFTWANALAVAASPILRIVYFPATLATMVALGPLGNVGLSLISALALIAIIVLFFQIAVSQVGWMYDQAAVKGFASMESKQLAKSGDMVGLMAHQARTGKIKAGKKNWLHRIKAKGPFALLWRELVIQRRSARGGFLIITLVSLVYALLPVFIISNLSLTSRLDETLGYMVFGFQAMGILMGAMTQSQSGFMEFLRRVDVLKPLPFSSLSLVVAEIFGKALIPICVSWFGSLVVLFFRPGLWSVVLSSIIFMPTLAGLLTAVTLVILLLFPDIDDPTQRSFRGLMSLLGIALVNLPGLASLVLITIFTRQIFFGALVAACLNAVMIVVLGFLAGNQYMNYNPSE